MTKTASQHATDVIVIGGGPGGSTASRKRHNRGGDGSANHALWRIIMVGMVSDPRSRACVARRSNEGRSKRDIIRSLKRYVAGELYRCLPRPQSA